MNQAIFSIIDQAKKDAAEYARVYNCQPDLKPAIEANHFAQLINEVITEIKVLATEHRQEIYRSPN